MPKQLTFHQIRDIVVRGAIHEFVDAFENEFIDFKGEPYHFDTDQQKAEFAKDVTTFANTKGGFIVLGVKTVKLPHFDADVAQEVRPIARELLQTEQYQSIARDWVYPPLHQLRVRFVPMEIDSDKGFLVIEIPETQTSDRPFLITKTTDGPARKDRRILFGYAERFESRSVPAVVQRLQQLLHLGLTLENYNSIHQAVEIRLERLESAMLDQDQARNIASEEKRGEEFKEYLHRATVEGSMSDRPRLWLSSMPEQPMTFPSFFSSANDPFIRAFESPPELRESGFDFALHKNSEIVHASRRRMMVQGYKLIQLSREGELIVLVLGDENFLAWASSGRPGFPIRINSFVLAETVYTFALYVKQIYSFAEPVPQSLRLGIGLGGMERDGKRPILSSLESRPNIMHSMNTDREAPPGDAALFVPVSFQDSAERMAFVLRAELYHWFGFDDDHLPYAEGIDSKRVVTRKSLLIED